MIYFTSDFHFGHDKPFIYEPRGFQTIEEMNEEIISRYNSIITNQDDVYILGDIFLGLDENFNYFKRLNGRKYVVIGNHDTDHRVQLYRHSVDIIEVSYAFRLQFRKYRFFLTHYPTQTRTFEPGEVRMKHVINLCGHTHTDDKYLEMRKGQLSYHVELNAHNNMPISIEQVIKDIQEF